jgi:hypothetical protein
MFNDRRRRTPAASFAPVLAVAFGVLIAATAVATSVIARSFHDLAVEADGVFAGTVTDVRSYRSDRGHIRTAVRFGELRWLVAPPAAAGATDAEKELHFAGGRLGEIAEVVGGMPQFTVGQRVVIFYRDTETASPIVGFHQGCFGLRAGDAGADTVFTADHRPVLAVEAGELVAGDAGAGGAMSLEDFAAAVARQRGGDR